jgi:class 3 adenylate cyclase/tetratricopeptide (TPR) repeat protein
MTPCLNCGTQNAPGRRFCMECGAALTVACPDCGSPNEPGSKFCGVCGHRIEGASDRPEALGSAAAPMALQPPPTAERRLVSVLFADLVGFTSSAERRDPEEVREFLSSYFDAARRVVSRYGGTIEKFIGDAVMAVWGTPVGQEDDAERAVRAALDLAATVPSIGGDTSAAEVRAAVCTGEAAVTLGADGQGMVAGDLVNTASRVQGLAAAGTVLVDEPTRRSTEAAIAYEDAGAHDVKGKTEPVRVWRAARVIAGRAGALRSAGLEAPFVGRDAELRLVKDLFHASAEEHKARLVSVTGIAGIGKSRLSWEFFKYIDGVSQDIYWHRGRCLAYGEGVSYWALAEMVRMRARIAEGEDTDTAMARLRSMLAEVVPNDDERAWIEPRLAALLVQDTAADRQRDDLFPAWRLFLERLAALGPTVLVFEDLQWADGGLLDFVDYLLEWSRNHALFVLALARPEIQDRHPGWSAGKRNFTSLSLDPLSSQAMEELLTGLVPGLPDEVRAQIMARAEGVPLYAVETVRMLIDRGLLVREGDRYRPAGSIESLEVPETLHALIAARLDGLSSDERRLVQDAAVLGKTFTVSALSAVSGSPPGAVEALLASLVRKEVLGLQLDPRSPERGQYGFLQDLVRRVAYETLSRRDRKARHLAAAAHLERDWTGDELEVAEIVASHYVEVYRALPDDPDAPEIRAKAHSALVKAGERAASLAANGEAQRYFDDALGLTDDPGEQAALGERAGWMAYVAGRPTDAVARLEAALALAEEQEDRRLAARISARLGEIFWLGLNRIEDGLRRMESAFDVLSSGERDEDLAMLAAQVGRLRWFTGDLLGASEAIEFALSIGEDLVLPEVLSQALNTKSLLMRSDGRFEEARALLRHALALGQEHDLTRAAARAMFNLADDLLESGRPAEALELDVEHLALVRRLGDRTAEWMSRFHLIADHLVLGRWDDAVALTEDVDLGSARETDDLGLALCRAHTIQVLLGRDELARAEEAFSAISGFGGSAEMQDRVLYAFALSQLLQAKGRPAEALAAAEEGIAARAAMSLRAVAYVYILALEAAFDADRLDRVEELLAQLEAEPPSQIPPHLTAAQARFRARAGARAGDEPGPVDRRFREAERIFRDVGMRFHLAVVVTEHAEWLLAVDRTDDAAPLLDEARGIFEELRATPWLDRVAKARLATAAAS